MFSWRELRVGGGHLGAMGCAVLVLGLMWSAQGVAQRQAKKTEARRTSVDVRGFIHEQRVIRGKEWVLRKFQDDKGLWKARLEVNGVPIREFGKGEESESWVRFLLWPIPAPGTVGIPNADLLFVLRYGGGVNGEEYLDIVDVRDNYRVVFESGEKFNFQRVEDLDEDGDPEVLGLSRSCLGVLDLPDGESPMPTVVLSYDAEKKAFVCRNKEFRGELDESIARFSAAFEAVRPVEGKITVSVGDGKTFLGQFAPLVRLAVELYYVGEEGKARELLGKYLSGDVAKKSREAIEKRLSEDRFYVEFQGKGDATAGTGKGTASGK